jgi:hypothetical protein
LDLSYIEFGTLCEGRTRFDKLKTCCPNLP